MRLWFALCLLGSAARAADHVDPGAKSRGAAVLTEPAALPVAQGLCEVRKYFAAAGKVEALDKRFREHTLALLAKHGARNVAYFLDAEGRDELTYILCYPSAEARAATWANLAIDPEWLAVKRRTDAEGRLVETIQESFAHDGEFKLDARPALGQRGFTLVTCPQGVDAPAPAAGKVIGKWTLHAEARPAPGAKAYTAYLVAHGEQNRLKARQQAQLRAIDAVMRRLEARRRQVLAGESLPPLQTACAEIAPETTGEDPHGCRTRLLSPTDYSPLQ